ncbi:MAG: M48 family metallopeptidase [Proteobacteria bacterium]|nr:M48 family metallopeptidase [Pseudomonadota bacterium]
MQIPAIFFDGEHARDNQVTLRLEANDLVFSGPDVSETRWSVAGLHPIDPPTAGQPFRITHDGKVGARLVIRDQAFIDELVRRNKDLKGGYSWKHVRDVAVWTVGGLAALGVIGYVVMSLLPQQVAYVLPEEWRNRVGNQVVRSLVDNKQACTSAAGQAAISKMLSVLANGNPDMPPVSVAIYDLKLVNAFAAPGGKIVFTSGILKEAAGPDEIAGVLAHEIGHVAYRHPEAQMVRLAGLQVLISVFTGTGGGDLTTNLAALAALLRYSRDAERQADAYARKTMVAASVDPTGLRRFFEKLLKIEGSKPAADQAAAKPSTLDRIGNVFSTHPGTEDRIKQIEPLPAGMTPVQILTPEEWKALQNICGT